MKLSKEELTIKAKALVGDSDDGISFLEDLTDSMDVVDTSEYETRISQLEAENASLTSKVDEVDKTWRDKYVARFGEGSTAPTDTVTTTVDETDDVEIPSEEEIANKFI